MSLWLLIAGAVVVCELLVVAVVLSLAKSSARADARAQREIEAWAKRPPDSHPFAVVKPGRDATPYPGVRERPGPAGARAAGARARPQR